MSITECLESLRCLPDIIATTALITVVRFLKLSRLSELLGQQARLLRDHFHLLAFEAHSVLLLQIMAVLRFNGSLPPIEDAGFKVVD